MSGTILYKNFVVKKGNLYRPYSILGATNVRYSSTGKRERNVYDIVNIYGGIGDIDGFMTRENTEKVLSLFFNAIGGPQTEVWYAQKTRRGFINSFFKHVISEEEFTNDGLLMEEKLDRKFSGSRSRRTQNEILDSVETKPFIDIESVNLENYIRKTVVAYNPNGMIEGIGRFDDEPYDTGYGRAGYLFYIRGKRNKIIPMRRIRYFKVA